MKKFFSLICAFLMWINMVNVSADTPYSVWLSAPKYAEIGEEFEIDIMINTSGNKICGVEFYLTYDPELYEFVKSKPVNAPQDTILDFAIYQEAEGILWCCSTDDMKSYDNVIWATVKFRVIGSGIKKTSFACVPIENNGFIDETFNLIENENVFYGNADMYCNCRYTSASATLTVKDKTSKVYITPPQEYVGKKIILYAHHENKLADIGIWTYSGEPITFISDVQYNKIVILTDIDIQNTLSVMHAEVIE